MFAIYDIQQIGILHISWYSSCKDNKLSIIHCCTHFRL